MATLLDNITPAQEAVVLEKAIHALVEASRDYWQYRSMWLDTSISLAGAGRDAEEAIYNPWHLTTKVSAHVFLVLEAAYLQFAGGLGLDGRALLDLQPAAEGLRQTSAFARGMTFTAEEAAAACGKPVATVNEMLAQLTYTLKES